MLSGFEPKRINLGSCPQNLPKHQNASCHHMALRPALASERPWPAKGWCRSDQCRMLPANPVKWPKAIGPLHLASAGDVRVPAPICKHPQGFCWVWADDADVRETRQCTILDRFILVYQRALDCGNRCRLMAWVAVAGGSRQARGWRAANR